MLRDKRGYETTYLMHWHRDGQRQRSRILYVFRTPGGTRVGREPLEPAVQRQLEREYPTVEFDWPSIFQNQQVVDSGPDQRRPRKRRRDEGSEPASDAAPARPRRPEVVAPAAVTPRPAVPAALEGTTPDEQVAFLATWYPQLRERVLQRSLDAERQQALLTLVERLNSALWTDADQVASGLSAAAEALERLSRVFARRRRRARKARRPTDGGAAVPGGPETAAGGESVDEQTDDHADESAVDAEVG